jgi:preprotein translocase subunit SecA
MFKNILRAIGGDPHKKEVERLKQTVVEPVNQLEEAYEQLDESQLRQKTVEFRDRLAGGETLDDLLPEAFAAVREASKRTLGMRPYDVQLICGAVLHQGKIAEMRTGEGKTLAATLPLYLNALAGKGVHLVTVNDYLARRDARWMAPIFVALGMSVGVLQMASRTDGAQKAFLVDLERPSPHEDRDRLLMVDRREAYAADITYGTNSEFGFDYLRDNQAIRREDQVQRGHYYTIIDEVDNILIDEARTPLIISGPASDDTEWYIRMAQIVDRLRPEDYEVSERDHSVALTEVGETHVEELLDMPLRDPERPEDITPEQARILGYLEQALRAKHLFKRNKDYLVQSGKVIIVDASTGRMMPGRRWSEGLHQAVEAKEGVKVNPENITYATITLQNYYRMYNKLCGMTGTALTESEEFFKIYKLDVQPIPTNLEYLIAKPDSNLQEEKTKDEEGYEVHFYARKDDPLKQPVFWKRKDYTDVVYRTSEAKLRAIAQEVVTLNAAGRPLLVGTTSVENSELLSRRLQTKPVRTLMQVLLMREIWMEKNDKMYVDKSNPALATLSKPLDDLNPGILRQTAREMDIDFSLNLEDDENLERLLGLLRLGEEHRPRLLEILKGGVPHMVLNARKHDEESKMIERAGAFGAVTIATNMAGRGVDIKLGGELAEATLNDINRILVNLGHDPYDMNNEERYAILSNVPQDQLSVVRAESVKVFLDYMQNMERVKELGGLHVIGSERYEARRIDNQLRGRAARQGDPGSSRYYLSLEDDLMRIFGGQQVEALWGRVFSDDTQPMELRLLGRVVEQSQERVEGANFDARKHVLEYDDVLNEQRKRIYGQRDMAFDKEDLSGDVLDILRTELQNRIKTGMADEEGPWRLMAFLEQVQPTLNYEGIVYPSYPIRVLIEEIRANLQDKALTTASLRAVILDIASRAHQARLERLIRSVQTLLDNSESSLKTQTDERLDALDSFTQGIAETDEENAPMTAAEVASQLTEAVRIPLRLGGAEIRKLQEGDEDIAEALRGQIRAHLLGITLKRVIGSLERRLGEELELQFPDMQGLSWDEASEEILGTIEDRFAQEHERLLGENGQITADLDGILARIEKNLGDERNLVSILMTLTQGTRTEFDRRTHERKARRYIRLRYTDLVAKIVEEKSADEVQKDVLQHLERGLQVLELLRGIMELRRLAAADATVNQMEEGVRKALSGQWGAERFEELGSRPLKELSPEEQNGLRELLGKRLQNQAYREILVRVISSQWVDYLTQIEALRISIGMEAYAQRDPLVQYKLKASGMFQDLLADIRMGVITRLFTYQPRRDSGAAVERERSAPASSGEPAEQSRPGSPVVQEKTSGAQSSKKKRRRH